MSNTAHGLFHPKCTEIQKINSKSTCRYHNQSRNVKTNRKINKNNIHIRVGVSQVSQLVVMISLINECYVM